MNPSDINQLELENIALKVKSKLHIDSLINYIKEYKEQLLEFSLYAGVGFLVGFLLKRFTTFFIFLVFFGGLLVILQHFHYLNFNYEKVYEIFGVQSSLSNSENLLIVIWEWVKINWLLSFGFSIGFLLGLKFS